MKRCLHCGAPLPDEARFCLSCMKRQKAPLLWPVEKRKYKPKALKKVVPLVLCAGVIVCFLLWGKNPEQAEKHPIVPVSSPHQTVSSETESQRPQESRTESESASSQESRVESSSSAEESEKKPVDMTVPGTVSLPDYTESPSSQESEPDTESSAPKEEKMSADELVAAIFENEQAKMEKMAPKFVWTDEDLGEYATANGKQEISVAAMTREEWEETSSYEPILSLADATWKVLYGTDSSIGGGSGVYHWKVVTKEEYMDPDYGYEMIHVVIQVQYRVDDPKETIAGVDTLSLIENVNRELSKTATHVDAVFDSVKGGFADDMSFRFEPTGDDPSFPHTQAELEKDIVDRMKWEMASYSSSSCVYDLRFIEAQTEEHGLLEFTFFMYMGKAE